MTYPNCRELIIDAYMVSGIRAPGENPDDDDLSIALRLLNFDLIDQLRNDELWPSYIKTYEFDTNASQLEYTIGVLDPNSVVPLDIPVVQDLVRIENAQVLIGNVWTPMRQISNSDYYRQTQAKVNVIPNQFAFNRTHDPYDKFMLSVASPGGYKIRISCNGVVANYGLNDSIDLPSGYYAALKYGLAELLTLATGLDDSQIKMNKKYSECLNRIKSVNGNPPPKLKTPSTAGLWSVGVDRVSYSNNGL